MATDPRHDRADRPSPSGRLVNLAAALHVKFETIGAVADLDDALACVDAAATQPMPDDATHAALLTNRCDILRARFRFTGRSSDLDDAVASGYGGPDAAAAGTP